MLKYLQGLGANTFKLSEPESFLMNHDGELTTTGTATATPQLHKGPRKHLQVYYSWLNLTHHYLIV